MTRLFHAALSDGAAPILFHAERHWRTVPEPFSLVALVAILLFTGLTQNALAQGASVPATTNYIPPNLFLTDGGSRHLFWYKRSGERLVEISTIEAAQRSKESRPASEDPEGHWGQATNGLQLSLRFEKEVYTNGEPVVARMLMRNVSNVRQGYSLPARVAAVKGGTSLKRKDDTGLIIVTVSTRFLHPQTQHLYQEELNKIFDLAPGEYTFWAVCNHGWVSSEKVKIRIRD